jgi:hypothetical protein
VNFLSNRCVFFTGARSPAENVIPDPVEEQMLVGRGGAMAGAANGRLLCCFLLSSTNGAPSPSFTRRESAECRKGNISVSHVSRVALNGSSENCPDVAAGGSAAGERIPRRPGAPAPLTAPASKESADP